MQVITLHPEDLETHASCLARRVETGPVRFFDAIVGVRNGGAFVCDSFCRYFPTSRYGSRYDVVLQRPSSKRKEGRAGALLKKLPTGLLDLLRMAEARLLSFSDSVAGKKELPDVEIGLKLQGVLRQKKNPEILLIDDAIDSGKTLSAIAATFKKINPSVRISVAVITVTTASPLMNADYALYRNRTLIRFPWSNDYRK